VIAVCVLPNSVFAQTWADAYRQGDYQAAADELHPLVIRQSLQPPFSDPEPLRHLAVLYGEGLGLSQDPIVACSLAQAARMATEQLAPEYVGRIAEYVSLQKDADDFVVRRCAGLSHEDGMTAINSMSCFAFGMPEGLLTLGSREVRVGRAGIRLDGTEAYEQGARMLDVCFQRVVRVRSLTIAPPPDAAPGVRPRDFVEVIGWVLDPKSENSALGYVLQWRLYELAGKWGVVVAHLDIGVTHDWRKTTMPGDFDARLSMEMIRSGHVRWRMEGTPPKRGRIMLREEHQ
jgi:hypothetical protein